MSNSSEKSSSGGLAFVSIIVGIGLMVGGTMASNQHIGSGDFQGLEYDLGLTVATIGVFLILFKVIEMFYFVPLRDAIHDRTSELESTFSEAESLRAEMAKTRTDYEQRLAQTEASAREQIQAQIKEAQNLRASLMAEASSKADALVKNAQDEIASEKAKVITELRVHVVDMALLAAEKVVGENMDNEKNRRLVDQMISQAEVKA